MANLIPLETAADFHDRQDMLERLVSLGGRALVSHLQGDPRTLNELADFGFIRWRKDGRSVALTGKGGLAWLGRLN